MGENRLALDAYAAAERADSSALVTNFINHEWGGVFVRMGRYPEADSAFRRMLARPDQNDQARGHRSLAYLDMLQGRYRSAIAHLTEAAVLSRATGARLSLMRNEVLLAEAHLVRDQPALASRELDTALEVARSQYLEPGFLALLGRMLVRAGRNGDARDVLARVEAALDEHHDGATPIQHARHMRDKVLAASFDLRTAIDQLETHVPDDMWPLPSYYEMLILQ
jgi:tetratricopeptide (TPR) repeat protein